MNDIFCFNLFNYCGESRLEENKSGPREVLQNGRCKVMVARNHVLGVKAQMTVLILGTF